MSKILTNNKYYSQIADVIREQNGTNNTYTPPQMVSALKDLFYEEVEGVPPITFQGIGENLLDYRIDGASGGVGERTNNLFEGEWTQGSVSTTGGIDNENQLRIKAIIPVMPSQTYTIRTNLLIRMIYAYNNTTLVSGRISRLLDSMNGVESAVITIPTNANLIAISLMKSDNSNVTPSDVEWTMLNFGSQPLPYEPYGYKVPVVVNGKNLLNNVLTSRTLNGVTITVNQDKSINISGQLDVSYKDFYVSGRWNSDVPLFEEGTYKLIVESTNNNIPITCGFNGSYATGITGTGNRVFTNQISSIMFRLTDSMTLNNETLKIMVCKPIIEDTSYEPYHETTTNIYLDNPILENESISLSDTNVNIPTIRGTNVLTVDTTVQPSNVYIQAPKDSLEAIQIANRLEEI